ncbi:MAG: DUF362 domain-containing protein [Desulfuromonadales bacterium]|nr:DUF362 domain-containing protein [Desulfuromonadales bacterium]
MNKRTFLKVMACIGAFFLTKRIPGLGRSEQAWAKLRNDRPSSPGTEVSERTNLGVDPDGFSRIYMAQGEDAEKNMIRVLSLLGGIESLIDPEDIVILKPNAQWWGQGMTNTDAMKAFIDAVLSIPGFRGEIIIAENHQYAEPNSRGWVTEKRNGAFNYNELVEHFQKSGYPQVTKYHWSCAGPNPNPLEGDASRESKIVSGPGEGDGYVWREDLVYSSPLGRKCMMTYPVFTSAYSGVTIDFKKGAWKDGRYTGQPVKFINFSAINHHGRYCGVTASVKNYMGIVDMTCGHQGSVPQGYHNTHFIGLRDLKLPFQKHLHWRVQKAVREYNWKYFYHTGAVLGRFMKEVRMADLNIITAHWVGYGSRTRPDKSAYPKTILAGRDPVALDYVATQNVLLPLTKMESQDKALWNLNDASIKHGPFGLFLNACHAEGVGAMNPEKHRMVT